MGYRRRVAPDPGSVRVSRRIHIPEEWLPLTSATIRIWVYEYLRHPWLLPPDPGPGRAKVRVVLPRSVLAEFRRISGGGASSALRRLIRWIYGGK